MNHLAQAERFYRPTRQRLAQIRSPFQELLGTEAFGGIPLLALTVAALVWANSPWAEIYEDLWHHIELTIGFGRFSLSEPLHFWINDALMVVFFFVVGLEIKRKVLVGELSSLKQAALPIATVGHLTLSHACATCLTWVTVWIGQPKLVAANTCCFPDFNQLNWDRTQVHRPSFENYANHTSLAYL